MLKDFQQYITGQTCDYQSFFDNMEIPQLDLAPNSLFTDDLNTKLQLASQQTSADMSQIKSLRFQLAETTSKLNEFQKYICDQSAYSQFLKQDKTPIAMDLPQLSADFAAFLQQKFSEVQFSEYSAFLAQVLDRFSAVLTGKEFCDFLKVPHFSEAPLAADALVASESYKLALSGFVGHQNSQQLQPDADLMQGCFDGFFDIFSGNQFPGNDSQEFGEDLVFITRFLFDVFCAQHEVVRNEGAEAPNGAVVVVGALKQFGEADAGDGEPVFSWFV